MIHAGTSAVVLDEATHVYSRRADGRVVPSNTEVLTFAYPEIKCKYFTEDGKEVGRAAHLACRLLGQGRLDWKSLDPKPTDDAHTTKLKLKVLGRARAYQKFLTETRFVPDLIEFVTYSEDLDVAGTIDVTGRFPSDFDGVVTLLDLKGGAESFWHAYQTAGYSLMEFPKIHQFVRRGALYLRDNGTYLLRMHKNGEDFHKFAAAAQKFHRANPRS